MKGSSCRPKFNYKPCRAPKTFKAVEAAGHGMAAPENSGADRPVKSSSGHHRSSTPLQIFRETSLGVGPSGSEKVLEVEQTNSKVKLGHPQGGGRLRLYEKQTIAQEIKSTKPLICQDFDKAQCFPDRW